MVRFDAMRFSDADALGLDHIRVDGALRQVFEFTGIVHSAFKLAHEHFTDNLSLLFRVGHTFQTFKIAGGSIHHDQTFTEHGTKGSLDLFSFTLAHQAGVNKNSCDMIANCMLDQGGGDGGVNPTGERRKNTTVSYLLADMGNAFLDNIFGGPGGFNAANFENEVLQRLVTVLGLMYFGVKLQSETILCVVCHGSIGRIWCLCNANITFWQGTDLVAVRHPDLLTPQMEQRVGFRDVHSDKTIFMVFTLDHFAA